MPRPPRVLKEWRLPQLNADDPRLFQEQLLDFTSDKDALAWYMACCCTIQSRATRPVAFPVMNTFMALFTPLSAAGAAKCIPIYHDLLDTLRPAGLYHVKATRIISLSQDWCDHHPYNKLSGASTYFQQSYEIFALGKLPRAEKITDSYLRAYVCARVNDSSSLLQ